MLYLQNYHDSGTKKYYFCISDLISTVKSFRRAEINISRSYAIFYDDGDTKKLISFIDDIETFGWETWLIMIKNDILKTINITF